MTLRPADNPFRMQRLAGLSFLPQGVTWDALLARVERAGFRGAIVGPRGSGKTTLLEQLQPHLAARGLRPRLLFRNQDGGGAMPPAWNPTLQTLEPADVLLVDGYTHLHLPARLRLGHLARRVAGLIITAHRPRWFLPTLLRTTTSPELLTDLVESLGGRTSQPHIQAMFTRAQGNLRNALRLLYDDAAGAPPRA